MIDMGHGITTLRAYYKRAPYVCSLKTLKYSFRAPSESSKSQTNLNIIWTFIRNARDLIFVGFNTLKQTSYRLTQI